jgi:hypothetical protein
MKNINQEEKKMKNKQAILFTITTFLLLLSVMTLSLTYLEKNDEMNSFVASSTASDKIRFIEDDIVSESYSDLLGIGLNNLSTTAVANVSFYRIIMSQDISPLAHMTQYKNFIQSIYSSKNNVNITLQGFNNTFKIEPYGTIFELNSENIRVFTIPQAGNYVQRIELTANIDAQNSSPCLTPLPGGASDPYISVKFNFIGGSCFDTIKLPYDENNDVGGKQFYMDTTSPAGYFEVKYGQLIERAGNGILGVYSSGVKANITRLDIIYDVIPNTTLRIKGGTLIINSSEINKIEEIILAEE